MGPHVSLETWESRHSSYFFPPLFFGAVFFFAVFTAAFSGGAIFAANPGPTGPSINLPPPAVHWACVRKRVVCPPDIGSVTTHAPGASSAAAIARGAAFFAISSPCPVYLNVTPIDGRK